MSFVGSVLVMVACAAFLFLFGLLAVHLGTPGAARGSLWQTFWRAVVLGDRHGLSRLRQEPRGASADTSRLQTVSPPL